GGSPPRPSRRCARGPRPGSGRRWPRRRRRNGEDRSSRARLLDLDLDLRLVLQRAQGLVGAGDDLLALLEPVPDLDLGLADDPGLHGAEAGLAALDDEDPLLLLALLGRGSLVGLGGLDRGGVHHLALLVDL